MKIPFALPDIGTEEIEETVQVMKNGWLTTASRCARFEEEFRAFVGSRHALVVNSATAALHLGLEALGVGPGDRVLVPTFTFTATAEVVRYVGADPVFVDCDTHTFCITKDLIEKALNEQRWEGRGQKSEVSDIVGKKLATDTHGRTRTGNRRG